MLIKKIVPSDLYYNYTITWMTTNFIINNMIPEINF